MSSHAGRRDQRPSILTNACDIFLWSLLIVTYSIVSGRLLGWGVDFLIGPGIVSLLFTKSPPRLSRREAFRSGVRIALLMMLAVGPGERLLRLALFRLAGEDDYAVYPPHHVSSLDPWVVFGVLFASLLVGTWLLRIGPTGAFRAGFLVGCTAALELLARSLALAQTKAPAWARVCTAVYVGTLAMLVLHLLGVHMALAGHAAARVYRLARTAPRRGKLRS